MKKSSDPRPIIEKVSELRGRMQALGCSSELSHIQGLFSIDIPPEVALAEVKLILDPGEEQHIWEYEEATLAHSDR